MSDVPSDTYECVPCKTDGQQNDAKHYCQQCKEHLCNTCRDQHRKFKELRDHVLVPISSVGGSESVQMASDEIYDCGPCKEEGHMNTGQHYCDHCDEYLCSTCRDYHMKFKLSRDHKIVSGPFLPKRPGSKQATTFGIHQVHDISNLTVKSSCKANIKLPGDDKTPRINGCTFMPGGRLLLCDYMNVKIKLLDSSLAFQESLDLIGAPWDLAVLDDITAVVTSPYTNELLYIEVTSGLSQETTVAFDRACYGVAVAGNEIYVSCHDGCQSTTGDVRVLDVRGNEKRRIGVNKDGSFMFKVPAYLAADSDGNKIYVSDCNTITCLKTNGDEIYRFGDDNLNDKYGMYVDTNGNIIVCISSNSSVQIVTALGMKYKILLIYKDGIKKPYAVDFRPSDGTLVVGCEEKNELCVFTLASE